jgi:hypothetical protein
MYPILYQVLSTVEVVHGERKSDGMTINDKFGGK